MLNEETIKKFKASLRGVLIQTTDEGYDNARKVYNAMIDRRPRLIARCADVADVIAAVNFGRQNNMLVAIRGGGHNAGGLSVCDDGLVIDLSLIKYTRIDPVARTVRAGGGCTWGEVDHATHAFGLATPAGVISTTGVGGLTLGGGLGHLTRRFSLTIDNLLSADMVLADGRFVTTSAEENEDLFWAIRGGGGNFGVVTSFLFRLHPSARFTPGRCSGEWSRSPRLCNGTVSSFLRDRKTSMAFLPSWLCRQGHPSRNISTTRRCAALFGATPARWIRPKKPSNPFAASRPRP